MAKEPVQGQRGASTNTADKSEKNPRPSLANTGNNASGSRRSSVTEEDVYQSSHTKRHSIPVLQMTYAWKKKMTTWFQRWDVNHDGLLTRADFEALADRSQKILANKHVKDKDIRRMRTLYVYMWENFVSPDEPSHLGVVSHETWMQNHFKARLEWDINPKVSASLMATFGLLFDAIDTSGDGIITPDEYKAFFNIMGINEDLAPKSFINIDNNSDGSLSKEEFLSTVESYYYDLNPSPDQLLQSCFLGPLLDPLDSNVDIGHSMARHRS